MVKRFTEEINEITRCCICIEFFTNQKGFPYLKTFVTDGKFMDPGDKETCLICGQEFTISQGGMAELPHNDLVADKKYLDNFPAKRQYSQRKQTKLIQTKTQYVNALIVLKTFVVNVARPIKSPNLVETTKC